jgi:hypothetical protein
VQVAHQVFEGDIELFDGVLGQAAIRAHADLPGEEEQVFCAGYLDLVGIACYGWVNVERIEEAFREGFNEN